MKISRVSAAVAAFAAISLLAACGGGGGGGTPPTNSGGPPPTSSNPSSTPTPTATPTSTSPPTTVQASSQTITAEEDWVNGDQNWYTSGTSSWSNHSGDTSSAPTGPTDGTSCTPTQEPAASNTFSQHAFVGIFANGTWEALPQAIGMQGAVAPTAGTPSHKKNNYEVENNACEYNVHTHDYSGLVHIEDITDAQSDTFMPSYANLQTLFDLWGAQLTSNGITAGSSSLSGAVSIYVGTPSTKVDNNQDDLVNSYKLYTGSASSLQFSKHMAVWIVIGSASPTLNGVTGLPAVKFVITN